ncbi:MAG: ABC transporter substrate-binding protein [Candidatus Cloacimonetes bacterium]|nr:ABC transporter substrate-binding protein [Candidatus Cloacimonadota bacterium]
MKSKLILCVLLTLLLIGCSDKDAPTVKKRDDFKEIPKSIEKSLNWMGHWMQEHDRATLVKEVAQNFELMNPDIEVNLKSSIQIMTSRGPEIVGKFLADMIKSGNIEWDVIRMNQFIYQHVAEQLNDPNWGKKHLVNFEEIEGFKQTQKSFIFDDPVYRNQTGGILVGPYIEGYYMAIFYNKDVAEKMGIEIKQYNMTFEDLLGYVKTVYEYNNKHNTNIAAFYESANWITMKVLFQNLFKSELESFDEAKKEVGSDEKNRAFLKTLHSFEELSKYNPLIDSYKDNVFFQTRHLVLNDECLFFINGIWMYNHWMGIDEKKTEKMIPAELPVFRKVNHYSGSFIPTWAVLKDSPNKEEAIKLLMFWSRPQIAEKWVRYAKAPTGLAGNISSSDIGNDPFDQFLIKIADKYGSNIHYSDNAGYILGKENQLLQQDINEKLLQILEGKITAQQVYSEIIIEVK